MPITVSTTKPIKSSVAIKSTRSSIVVRNDFTIQSSSRMIGSSRMASGINPFEIRTFRLIASLE